MTTELFDKTIVGVDGRSGGRDAIALARQLVPPAGQLEFVNVYSQPRLVARAGDPSEPAQARAEELLLRERQEAGVAAELVALGGRPPGRVLQDRAAERGANLIVVGSSQRSAIGRVMLGDDSIAALNGAPCAVAIAPAGYAAGAPQIRTIGVGSDGSPESELALEAGRILASRHGAALRALAVVSLQSVPSDSHVPLDWTTETEQAIDRERARLQALDDVQGDVVYGDPTDELYRLSDELDLLIVGSRSHGPLGRLLNGSTSTYLARRAPCPLLVLPRSLTATGPAPPDGPSPDPPELATPPS